MHPVARKKSPSRKLVISCNPPEPRSESAIKMFPQLSQTCESLEVLEDMLLLESKLCIPASAGGISRGAWKAGVSLEDTWCSVFLGASTIGVLSKDLL